MGGKAFLPKSYNFQILFTETRDYREMTTINGLITDGSLNHDQERPCRHYHSSGSLIAIQKSMGAVATSVEEVAFAPEGVPIPLPLYTWDLKKSGYKQRVVIPGIVLFHDSGFKSHRDEFPDHLPTLGTQFRNCYAQITYFEGIYTCMIGYESRSNSAGIWASRVYSMQMSIDFVRRTAQVGTSNTPFSRLAYLDLSAPPRSIDLPLFPSTWREYERLFSRARKQYLTVPDNEIYGDLVRRCANDARVIQTNSIELVKELSVITETLRSTYNLFKGKVDPKNLASAYLSYKYGLRLTANDLKTIADDLSMQVTRIRETKSFSRARERIYPRPRSGIVAGYVVDFNYKLIYFNKTDDCRDFIRNWFNTGLFPSLTNAWDLIPFSFVADWFLDIESRLDAIDANTYWSTYHISSVTYSKKETFSDAGSILSDSDWTLFGDASLIYYDRRTSREAHKPSFFESKPREFQNYAELTALIIANKQ